MSTPRTIPAEFGPRERHAVTVVEGDGYWKVFDHSGSEFFGFEAIASRLTEKDARLLVFGAKAVGFLRMLANHPEVRLSMFAGDLLELLEVPT
jgi:hypothetical protein